MLYQCQECGCTCDEDRLAVGTDIEDNMYDRPGSIVKFYLCPICGSEEMRDEYDEWEWPSGRTSGSDEAG